MTIVTLFIRLSTSLLRRKIGLFKNDYKGRTEDNRQRYFSYFYSAFIDEFKSGEVYSGVEIISNSNPTVAALFKFSVENLTVAKRWFTKRR